MATFRQTHHRSKRQPRLPHTNNHLTDEDKDEDEEPTRKPSLEVKSMIETNGRSEGTNEKG